MDISKISLAKVLLSEFETYQVKKDMFEAKEYDFKNDSFLGDEIRQNLDFYIDNSTGNINNLNAIVSAQLNKLRANLDTNEKLKIFALQNMSLLDLSEPQNLNRFNNLKSNIKTSLEAKLNSISASISAL